MKKTIVIHSENVESLRSIFRIFNSKFQKNNFILLLHSKNYIPWVFEDLKNEIVSFSEFYAYPTEQNIVSSIVELILKSKTNEILILDENSKDINLKSWNIEDTTQLLAKKEELLKFSLDTKYDSLKWFIIDILSQKTKQKLEKLDNSNDSSRYSKKIASELFFENKIYIDGGLGDHVMALPLLEKISESSYICCKYPVVLEHLKTKGFINWNDELFGGYNRFVYSYGSANNSKTIIDAFFEMYGVSRQKSDILKYNGKKTLNIDLPQDKKIVLICTSAAKINDTDSNKDWRDIRWFKLVNELKKNNYFVVQCGTKKDNQIPNVDYKFLDKPISDLAGLIDKSDLWISVDTFFHHFASSIKPEVGICLTPFYNDHAKHPKVKYIEKDCKKDFSDRKWWLDLQQPERKECMDMIQIEEVLNFI